MNARSALPAVDVVGGRGGVGIRRRRRTSSLTRTATAAAFAVAAVTAASAGGGYCGATRISTTRGTRQSPRRGRRCCRRCHRRLDPLPPICRNEGGNGGEDDSSFDDESGGQFHPLAFVAPPASTSSLPTMEGRGRSCELQWSIVRSGERRSTCGHQPSTLHSSSSVGHAWVDSSSLPVPSRKGEMGVKRFGQQSSGRVRRKRGAVSPSTSTSLKSLSSSSANSHAGNGAKNRPRKGGSKRTDSSPTGTNVRSDTSGSTTRRRGAREALKETSASGKGEAEVASDGGGGGGSGRYDASRLPKNVNRRERTGRRRSAAESAPDTTNLRGKKNGGGAGAGTGARMGDTSPFRYDPSVATNAPPYNPVNGRRGFGGGGGADASNDSSDSLRPLPTMPSHQFVALAQSQFDLLANSLPLHPPLFHHGQTGTTGIVGGASKAKSMALYLPRENVRTGQLEFVPAVTYPPPDAQQRVFIANDADAKRPPQIPRRLTRLPGFARAKSLLPRYPFASPAVDDEKVGGGGGNGGFLFDLHDDDTSCGCGPVEQVTCDEMLGGRGGADAGAGASEQCPILSVALYRGSSTVGVFLVWPSDPLPSPALSTSSPSSSCWTDAEIRQVWRAAYGLSMALSMDRTSSMPSSNGYDQLPFPVGVAADRQRKRDEERILLHDHMVRTDRLRTALADNLHQVKNPLQALRTFARLLQRKLAQEDFFQQQRLATRADGVSGEDTAGGSDDTANRLGEEEVNWAPLRSLAENVLVQSDRLTDRLGPMDDVVAAMEGLGVQQPPALPEVTSASASSLSLYAAPPSPPLPSRGRVEEAEERKDDDPTASSEQAPGSTGMATAHNWTAGSTGSRGESLFENKNPLPATFDPPASNADANARNAGADAVWFGPPPTTTSEADVLNTLKESWSSPSLSSSSSVENPPPAAILPGSPHVGDLEVEMAFVPDVVEPILSACSAVASERGVSFEVVGAGDELPGARVCPQSLQEALANVVDNAIKYSVVSRSGGDEDRASVIVNPRPKVRVSLLPNSKPYGPGVTILVEDNGPGIPASERGAVFERGYRGEVTRDIRGQGIGLGISRALIGRMGGTLEIVDNDPTSGDLGGTMMRFMLFRDVI